MTFVMREISLTFRLARGEKLADGESDTLTLAGHRCEAIIENPGGNLNLGRLQLRVYGMKLADMNKFSTNHVLPLVVRGDSVSLSAGDAASGMKRVFEGTITSACVNYQGMPDIAFDVYAQSGFLYQVKDAAVNSLAGEVDVATLIESLAKQMGYAFKNNGVNVKLSNPYLHGTLIEQLLSVTEAARIPCSIENETVTIWPNDGSVEGDVIQIGPGNGLVGYPSFTRTGIQISAEFRPEITLGRRVSLQTSVEKARGEWYIQNFRHELSTVQPHGPWFSIVNLAERGFYVAKN